MLIPRFISSSSIISLAFLFMGCATAQKTATPAKPEADLFRVPAQSICVPRCNQRFPSGECSRFDSPFCGEDVSCAAQCLQRFPSGKCSVYGPDFCGRDAGCDSTCVKRFPSGACSVYGADYCSGRFGRRGQQPFRGDDDDAQDSANRRGN